VQGTELRSYPALVDRGSNVDLVLLESQSAAERASRAGIERLLRLLAQKPLAALSKRRPPPFPRGDGVPNARTAVEAFHEQLEGRVLREAFGLQGSAPLPRTQTAFLALGGFGLPRIDVAFDRLAKAIAGASAALDQTYRALKASASQPSGTHAARDLRGQLEALFPPDLLDTLELERLEQLPRYLKAAQQRLARAIVDPRKDAEKNAPLAPLWQQFVERRPQLRDSVGAARWRWAFEELRVAVFAPELRAASAPSVANLAAALSALA
jgi:ATP-dependent helicase HrpA